MTVTRKRESRGIVTSEEKVFKRTFVKVLFLMRGRIQLSQDDGTFHVWGLSVVIAVKTTRDITGLKLQDEGLFVLPL